MNIGLLDIDGHNFPNLALMKISSYHKARGDSVEFATMFGKYDILCKSKIFTFSIDPEYCYNAERIYYGGTGYDIKSELPKDIDAMMPDYSLYNCEHAYGFLTRGCPNKCEWCFVPEKEGNIKPYADIDDFIGGYNSAILMDNNVLTSDHGINQIEKIINKKIRIDFNQGLDARLIDDSIAKLLARVKWLHPIRLACDSDYMINHVDRAVVLLRKHGAKPECYFCYVLVKDIESAHRRVEFLRSVNVDPYAQPFRDKKNTPITQEQKRFCRWVNHKAIFKSVSWNRYGKDRHSKITDVSFENYFKVV